MTASSESATWPSGFDVQPRQATLSPQLLDAFKSIPVAHAGDVMGRHTGAVGLKAYHHDLGLALCGTAITVRTRPGDNLMVHVAMQRAQPGDVIVIDGGGDLSTAVIGGLMRTTAVARQLGGFVLDGALRDVAEWAEGGLPVYARGHVHRGPSKDGPGQINVPISCAGMTVMPGDLILGDADGVIAIPANAAEAILALCQAHAQKEARIRAQNETGAVDRERFDLILRQKGCPL
ncbi:RraA family protein [Halomonas dongshanensis]|uniref:Putative 4-hydroxy-4-methyl-2-oxoglutarate aldolase n=1 Tax=Halomonas dongshanensis TaxID=2890835 RepID=A0ABT2EAC6_9GAMM|nr:RraA family protein [Halomonas dongshanensis]MCS2608516.1 RraA family protein [Halomonas dongshanensis]